MFIALVFACSIETGTKIYNNTPEIFFVSHVDGDSVIAGASETFVVQVSDLDNSIEEMSVKWDVGDRTVCEWENPDINSQSSCNLYLGSADDVLTAVVTDDEGAAESATLSLTVLPNTSPTAEILDPLINTNYYADEQIVLRGMIGDEEDWPDLLQVSWLSSNSGELEVQGGEPDSSGLILGTTSLSMGAQSISLQVIDSGQKQALDVVDVMVHETNTEPQCSLIAPEEDEIFSEGDSIIFSAEVLDGESSHDELAATWSSDLDGEFGSSVVESSGELSLSYSNLSSGAHTITLRATDDGGEQCAESTRILINDAPQLSLLLPDVSQVYSTADPVLFSVQVSDNLSASANIGLTWESSVDGIFSTEGPAGDGMANVAASDLSPGSHAITVTATDEHGEVGTLLFSLEMNEPPEITGRGRSVTS